MTSSDPDEACAPVLGLRRYAVRLVDHRPQWAQLFAAEAEHLREVCGECVVALHHVGSTAVPDLVAKPIIDIAVAVDCDENLLPVVERLIEAGYDYRGDAMDAGGHVFVKEPEPDLRTVHVHVVCQDDPQVRQWLAFRDLLRRDAEIRARYAASKRELAAQYPEQRALYTDGKHEFIEDIVRSLE